MTGNSTSSQSTVTHHGSGKRGVQEETPSHGLASEPCQACSALSSELWLPAKQRLLVVAGSGVLIQERVCVKRASQLLLLLSLFSYSLHLQKLLVCRQTRRMLSSEHEQTESQVWPGNKRKLGQAGGLVRTGGFDDMVNSTVVSK